eukprot:TRINITY_DN22164_c0_g1_i2.p1 TRINITY_DN22164_c0_g1~~TRINITY_DN22164_c0_g1_i2.p1  ORF type:complete len:669 (-),score=100.59 TRINITY_DN22164_c0_g1_i2:324-2249(-)
MATSSRGLALATLLQAHWADVAEAARVSSQGQAAEACAVRLPCQQWAALPEFPTWCQRDAYISGCLIKTACRFQCAALGFGRTPVAANVRPAQQYVQQPVQQPVQQSSDGEFCHFYKKDPRTYCAGDTPYADQTGFVKDKCQSLCAPYLTGNSGNEHTGGDAASPPGLTPGNAPSIGEQKPEPVGGLGADHQFCSYYADTYPKGEDLARVCFNNYFENHTVKENCPTLCSPYDAAEEKPEESTPAVTGKYAELLGYHEASSCARQPACAPGGYNRQMRPSFQWDIQTGCWQESCIQQFDISTEVQQFRPRDKVQNFKAAVQMLHKLYPLSAKQMEYQEQFAKQAGERDLVHARFMSGVFNFMHDDTVAEWLNVVNQPSHENTHVHHTTSGVFRPSPVFSYEIRVPWLTTCTEYFQGLCQYGTFMNDHVINAFPRQREIFHLFGEEITEGGIGGADYFRGEESECGSPTRPPGCYRLWSIMTETEAYLHGNLGSAAFRASVGKANKWQPYQIPEGNSNNGAAFPIAFWSLANVYYLQLIQQKYNDVWQKLLGNGEDWTAISEIFLAHIDRAAWYLRLALDVNELKDSLHLRGAPPKFPPQKYLSNKCRRLQKEALEKNDVLAALRAAVIKRKGQSTVALTDQ